MPAGPTTTAAPDLRTSGMSMSYDTADGEFVLFGGYTPCSSFQCPTNATWTFARGVWSGPLVLPHAPPVRSDAAMTYDANAGGVLLFGGQDYGLVLNDTWLFRSGTWTNLTDPVGPAPRAGATLTFDPEEHASVLFGGCDPTFGLVCYSDTWTWSPGVGWARLSVGSAPPARWVAAATFDPIAGALVLFGGGYSCGQSDCLLQDTWEFYSNAWWKIAPSASIPDAREAAAMAPDAALGGVVLYGGSLGFSMSGTIGTWLFAGGAWSLLVPGSAIGDRARFAMASDSSGLGPLVVAGFDAYYYGPPPPLPAVAWVFEVAPTLSVSPALVTPEAWVPTTLGAQVVGGTPPYTATVQFDDGSVAVVDGAGPTLSIAHTFATAGFHSGLANLTDARGVYDVASFTQPVDPASTVSILPADAFGDVGLPIAFNAVLAPTPMGPGSFAWRFGDGSSASGPSVTHAFATPDRFEVQVDAIDPAGAPCHASMWVAIAPTPSLALVVPGGAAYALQPLTFGANLSGGTGPFTFAWSFGDGGTSTSPSPSHEFAAGGTYTVTVNVTDAAGSSTERASVFTVAASNTPGGPTTAFTPPSWVVPAFVVLGAIALVGAILLWRTSRRR